MKHKALVIAASILLIAAGAFFEFVLAGYRYVGALLVVAAAVLNLLYFSRKTARWIYAAILSAAVVFFAVLEIPIVKAARTDAPPGCGYIVVLGAGVNGDVPSLSLVNRLDAALAYLEANPGTMAIVTGGRGEGENITEAEAMDIWLEARGIAPERIIQEPNAIDTKENLSYSFDIVRGRGDTTEHVAVVSSEYHLYRAKLIASELGVTVTGIAGKTTLPVLRFNYFIREGGARIYYMIFGVA